MKQKILLIGGPTAVGKTKLGITCAKVFDGEIISADCEQIYKHLDIGSAKPTKFEQEQAVHHMIDILEPTDSFSVAEFKLRATQIIDDLSKKGKLPIIVGGTGLYLKTLLFPYELGCSQKDDAIRQKYKTLAEQNGNEYVFDILEKVDPQSASKLHPNDLKRVVRALEIYELTGKTKSSQSVKMESPYDYKIIFLNDDRAVLYDRINKRVDQMFDEGLESEVLGLIKSGLTRDNQSMQGIGYREFFDYVDGLVSHKQLVENIKKDSRNYAKRQITWFRHMENAQECSIQNIEHILDDIKNWLKN